MGGVLRGFVGLLGITSWLIYFTYNNESELTIIILSFLHTASMPYRDIETETSHLQALADQITNYKNKDLY